MRDLFRLFHILFFGRAILRGPRSFARYEVRRQARKAVAKLTRAPRRRRR